jgi:hypothetical protein
MKALEPAPARAAEEETVAALVATSQPCERGGAADTAARVSSAWCLPFGTSRTDPLDPIAIDKEALPGADHRARDSRRLGQAAKASNSHLLAVGERG